MTRSGRSAPSAPAITPHASSGCSSRACATISSTRSRRMTSTRQAYGAAAGVRTPAERASHPHAGVHQAVLHEREPVVDRPGGRRGGRRRSTSSGIVLVDVERGAQREPHVVERAQPRVAPAPRSSSHPPAARGQRRRARRPRRRSLASISSGSCSERRPAARSASSVVKSGSSRASTGSLGRVDGPVRMPVSSASSSAGLSAARLASIWRTSSSRPRSTAASCASNVRDQPRLGAAPRLLPAVHELPRHDLCCMVAHRPAACSFATSPSIFSLSPADTAALPLWCTSSISAVAFGSG